MLRFTLSSRLKLWFPTNDTSSDVAQGSIICAPPFHCHDDGSVLRYSYTASAGGPSLVNPALPSVWSCPYRTVMFLYVGGFCTCGKMAFPSGRSKKRPAAPRRTMRPCPVRSYAMPNRGATASIGHVYVVLTIPWPDRNRPLVALPDPGTSVPIASTELGPRSWPVTGSIACRFDPEQGYWPLAQPATYKRGAAEDVHCSGRKLEAWPSESYCGCWCT